MYRHLTRAVDHMPPDFQLSPFTGWTREHYEAVTTGGLLALRRYASHDRARFYLPGPASVGGAVSDALEAFTRSLLGVSYLLGGGGDDPHDFAGWYAEGITSGVDPNSSDAWPRLVSMPQARVEAACLAVALHPTRELIWDQLSSTTQTRVIDWLLESNDVIYPRSNWVLFFAVTQAFLRSVGAPTDEERVETCLSLMESCHLGGGWYSDGPFGPGEALRSPQVDWYNSFVIHHYFARYAAMTPDLDPYRRQLWIDRLAEWASDAVALFGADGAPVFQGRSLVYRFGLLASLVDAAGVGVGPPPGQIRRIASGALRYFHQHRAFDAEGLLSLGWHDAHERMRQVYSGPGSPYWAMHGMTGLMWPPEHPFWTSVEEAAPTEVGDVRFAVPGCSWLVTADQRDGIVRVSNHGVDHVQEGSPGPNPLYDRLAHSSATAPVETSGGLQVGDNRVVLRCGGRVWNRRLIQRCGVNAIFGWSRWALDDLPNAPVVSCVSVPRGQVEVRLLRVDFPRGEPVTLTTSGWPLMTGLSGQVVGLLGTWTSEQELSHDQPMAPEVRVDILTTEVSGPEWVAVAVTMSRGDWVPLPSVSLKAQPAGHTTAVIAWADGTQDSVLLPPSLTLEVSAPA